MTNNYKKMNVFYIDFDYFAHFYESKKVDYSKIGIAHNPRIPICEIMYSRRKQYNNKSFIIVDKSSYSESRTNIVNATIDILFKAKSIGRGASVVIRKYKGVKWFVAWMDDNNYSFPKNINQAKEMFIKYSTFLRLKIKEDNTMGHAEATSQRIALDLLETYFNDNTSQVAEGIPLITSVDIKNKKEYKIPPVKDFTFILSFFHGIFSELNRITEEKAEFPCKVRILDKEYWIASFNRTYVLKNGVGSSGVSVFDPVKGASLLPAKMTENYIMECVKKNKEPNISYKYQTKRLAKAWQERLQENNTNINSNTRLKIANTAMQAYFILFLFQTGMNDSTAASLGWNDDYNTLKEEQKFRTVKYRAGNKDVEFSLQSNFMREYNNFIKLREFVLQGKKCDNLFFNYNDGITLPNSLKTGNYNIQIRKLHSAKFETSLPSVTSRDIRKFKANYIINKHGGSVAAQALQNSLETTINKYVAVEEENSKIELKEYFSVLNKSIFACSETEISTSIGHCSSYGNPSTVVSIKSISTDCSHQEGCLFCEHYKTHADSEDIAKLFSLLYVIKETRYISEDKKQFDSIFTPVKDRIKSLLNFIETIIEDKNIIYKVKSDVFEQELLHPYWESKLSMLYRLGVFK